MSLITEVLAYLSRGIFGLIGAGLFFLSWTYQLYISHKDQKSKVDMLFWVLRSLGMAFLTIHTIITRDWILTTMNGVGMFIYLYNIYLMRR